MGFQPAGESVEGIKPRIRKIGFHQEMMGIQKPFSLPRYDIMASLL
jgi:hypothetical protein